MKSLNSKNLSTKLPSYIQNTPIVIKQIDKKTTISIFILEIITGLNNYLITITEQGA